MSNKYFIVIAKEKDDGFDQEIEYLGIYDCFSFALEQITNHNKQFYFYGCREFNYYIFLSNINEKILMKEEDCIYSLTSKMCKDYKEYIKDEYKQIDYQK